MKKLVIPLFTILTLLIAIPGLATIPKELKVYNEEARILISWIYEIEKIDKFNPDHIEKRELREEVKTIQRQLKTLNSGGGVSSD